MDAVDGADREAATRLAMRPEDPGPAGRRRKIFGDELKVKYRRAR